MRSPRSIVAATAFVVCLTLTGIPAQLSGYYTVDPTGTGSRNFKTLADAATLVTGQGVAGPVVFQVASATYVKEAVFGPITGTSALNTVTFRSATRHGAKSVDGIWIPNPQTSIVSWLVFDGFEFRPNPSNSKGGFRGYGRVTDIVIKNCLFTEAYLIVGSTGDTARRWNVHHNKFIRSSCLFSGAQELEIHHNEFDRNNFHGDVGAIQTSNTSAIVFRSRVYNNLIYCVRQRLNQRCTGIRAGRSVDVFHNTIVVHNRTATVNRCLWTDAVAGRDCRIGNNILVNLGKFACVGHRTTGGAISSDGNLFQTAQASGYVVDQSTLVEWQKTGNDKNSVEGDPQFVTGSGGRALDFVLRTTSPAVGKAVNTPSYIVDDFFGNPRGSKNSIGAFEGGHSTFYVYGRGCAGAGGFVPTMGSIGELKMGSTSFGLVLRKASGASRTGFLALGVTKVNVGLGGGCFLLVSPDLVVRVPIFGVPGPGNGSALMGLPLPSDPRLKGAHVRCQWGVIDPAAAGIGIAFSQAATLTL
jgi:hypothetical protein